jgi:hypothetical protein
MELMQTTEQVAKNVLESKKRIIKATKGDGIFSVNWINDNNHTCGLSSRKGHEFMVNNEDVIFFIQVPKNAKTVY